MTEHVQGDWKAVRKLNQKASRLNGYHSYRARHPEMRRACSPVTDFIHELLLESAACCYCNHPFTSERPPTIDHVKPLTRGGKHVVNNITACCKRCNTSKGNKLDWSPRPEWMYRAPPPPLGETEFG